MFNIKCCFCVSYKINLANDRLHNLSRFFLTIVKVQPFIAAGFRTQEKEKRSKIFPLEVFTEICFLAVYRRYAPDDIWIIKWGLIE